MTATSDILEQGEPQDMSVKLDSREWANMLKRFRREQHNVRLFWMSVASLEGQVTEQSREKKR